VEIWDRVWKEEEEGKKEDLIASIDHGSFPKER
jgi:hypothetical protein